MTNAVDGLKPELFWRYFAEIALIPRPSKHEELITRYVLDTAEKLGLRATQDGGGNIVVKKPASPGRELVRSICLQAHLDMVCEKNADKIHDFLKDPIELVRKDAVIMANGTTLGADNGVGVAANLAVMADRSLVHGPLELLFTVDEETGLTGAQNLDPALVESRTLLNLDSEEEGVLIVGCSGGRDTMGRWRVAFENAPAHFVACFLSVKGLRGGHSGLEIDKGLGNAVKLLNRAVMRLSEVDARLSSIDGGKMRNAIPRECGALLFIPREKVGRAEALVSELNATFRGELASVEPDLAVNIKGQGDVGNGKVLVPSLQQQLCRTIAALPHGVLQMSADIPGLAETSTNLASVATTENDIVLVTSQRSSVASRLTEAVDTVSSIFELGGARIEASDGYPGWKPNLASPILMIAQGCYRSLNGKDAKVSAIHAGLECGIIGERFPGMDMVSFGPTLEAVHSPDEKIYIESVAKFWEFKMAADKVTASCCIAGGGPAGIMLGLLLARAGVEVLVLEKHADFLRDFRGDTIHPSTLEVMHELGLLDDLLKLPHQKAPWLNGHVGGLALTLADFTHLPTRCRFIAFMPQWDFLNFLAERGARYPTFRLLMRAEVTGLIEEGGSVVGLRAATPDGPLEVRADLVVGADGRHSAVRALAGLKVHELGAPMDVLWFRLSRQAGDPEETTGRFDSGQIFVTINRGAYWQCGFVIPKGSLEQLQDKGLQAFRDSIVRIAPFAADRVGELLDWDAVRLLTVQVDRLPSWYRTGLLCIGDAAHAMSPIGGVGINLAIQDAVAAANLLAEPLRSGRLASRHLELVQQRREWPTCATQRMQLFVQNRVIKRVLESAERFPPPRSVRFLARFPVLRRIPARLIGIGFRPEHVRTRSVWPEADA
jgi:dipeptidase D